METHSILKLGEKYSKKELSELLKEQNLSKIREGLYHCKNSNSTLFFVDLEKKGKEKRFHFNDFYEGEFFHWDSQTTQHINTPRIQEIVKGIRVPHLFVRVYPKIKSKTQPFVYCGRLKYMEHEEGTSKPVHMVYQSIDYDDYTENDDLLEIYLWKPGTIGKNTSTKIVKRNTVSKERKIKYKKPNETERTGLVTSRVGQGYYRQQIIEKWNGKCPVTNCKIKEILISSHIVPWSESSDEEKLDSENGILLTPNIDSLFDKHIVSFKNNGEIIISDKLSQENLKQLGLSYDIKIPISKGMKKYLEKHRKSYYEKN